MDEEPVTGYLYGRKVKHQLPSGASLNSHRSALCGSGPPYFTFWCGSGSQKEIETLAELPLCARCARLKAKYAEEKRLAEERLANWLFENNVDYS